ncbi:MAG: hypothetical protein Q9191_000443 [Dirinaria sp. TL-2023a]
MSEIRSYLLTVDNDKSSAEDIAHVTARKLESKQTTLIEVVQSLGEYINDEDATIRAKAVQFLSSVIGAVPSNLLTIQQVQVLCQFLCDRIEDGGAVGGLQKLSSLRRFNREMAKMTTRAMLEHFQDLQIRPQSQRLQILELLNNLMLQHRQALKEMGDEFIVGVTDLVSGEKDPRNLMIIFSILKAVMVEWDISSHAEPMFDSVFCYFPITFRPPPDDPYGITAQDLKDRLRDCVAASSLFAPFAFPQLIDKLDSTSPNVKKDVLQTITACASSYSVSVMSNYSITLWDALKFEILNVQEADLAEEALSSLQAIAIRLSHGLTTTDPKTHLARYFRPIAKECNEQLQEPQHKQAKPAGQILSSMAATSPVAFFLIVKAVVPPLLTLYEAADSIAKQRALLEVFVQLFSAAIVVQSLPDLSASESHTSQPLDGFHDRLFELTSQALMSTSKDEISLRIVASKGLLRLCSLRKYLSDAEIGMAVQYFDEIVLDEEHSRDDLKNEAIEALVQISKLKPNLIMDITFPAFMARLPDSNLPSETNYLITLEGLAQLSVEKSISDTLVRRLINKLEVVLQAGSSPAYPQAILSSLTYVLSSKDLPNDPNLSSYHQKIVVGLVTRAVLGSTGEMPETALNSPESLETLGRLVNLIVRALSDHKQTSVVDQVYSLFLDEASFLPIPFRKDAPEPQRRTMILSTFLAAAIRREIPISYLNLDNPSSFLQELTRLAITEDVPSIRHALVRQLALVVNKNLPSSSVHYATELLWAPSTGLLHQQNLLENTIRTIFWISKALILRLAHTEEVLSHLLPLLSDTDHGLPSARGFSLLLAPDEIISKENGAVIRLLTKQHVFHVCVPRLASDFRSADKLVKPNYLIALSGIIKHVPTSVLMPEIDTLLPLLLQSLDLPDQPDVKAATIDVLTTIATENPSTVESHISSLVTRLLAAASDRKSSPPKTRLAALQCLRILPGRIKDSTLLPFRGKVTWALAKRVLDDPKRAVRREGIECRAKWLGMDEPESE